METAPSSSLANLRRPPHRNPVPHHSSGYNPDYYSKTTAATMMNKLSLPKRIAATPTLHCDPPKPETLPRLVLKGQQTHKPKNIMSPHARQDGPSRHYSILLPQEPSGMLGRITSDHSWLKKLLQEEVRNHFVWTPFVT